MKISNKGRIELKDYLNELKNQIFLSEKTKKSRKLMRVRSLEVELETIVELKGEGGFSFHVVHGDIGGKTQNKNKIKITLVSPDIIRMEENEQLLSVLKGLPDVKKGIDVLLGTSQELKD